MMNNDGILLLKFKPGVYIWSQWHSVTLSCNLIAVAYFGVRSPGKTVVIDIENYRHTSVSTISHSIEQKIGKIDRFIVCGDSVHSSFFGDIGDFQKKIGRSMRGITDKVVFLTYEKFLKDKGIERYQLNWIGEVFQGMVDDSRFLLGQINDRLRLNNYKMKQMELERLIEKKTEELANLKAPEQIQQTNIKNIMNMKWIDKIEGGPDSSLRILTKPMACTYVPNIGRYIPFRYFARSDVLYRMMKYQALGKYFIVLPSYYIVNKDFSIKADMNDRYPRSLVRNVMINTTYFHDMACHIGNGQACVGELAAAIGAAQRNGLDMLLMSFEAYLRSINLPDAAGQRYFCLPMGDADGNVEVWPYVEGVMKREGLNFKDKKRTLDNYEEVLQKLHNKYNERFDKYFDGSCESWSEEKQDENMRQCLELIKQREPQVYEQIMTRIEKGAVI